MRKDFYFVDFAAKYQTGFRNNIINVREVPGLVKHFKGYECYATYFFFTKDLRVYVRETGSVASYDGVAFAPYLVLDIDNPVLGEALESVRSILLLLLQNWKLPHEAVQCYFSGSKGFHIMIDSRVFGDVRPSRNLHIVFSKIRETIAKHASVYIDLAIKDKLRLIRIPNTINRKSGLYKIQLSIDEIMRLKTGEIIERAKKQQKLTHVDSSGLMPAITVKQSNRALTVYEKALSSIKERTIEVKINYRLSAEDPENILCEARKKIWQSHIDEGLRHNCAMRILSQFHISGFEKEKSLRRLMDWNRNNKIALPEREIVRMVDSVYSSPHPYSYGCRDSILQIFCPYREKLRGCVDYRTQVDTKK